MPVAAFALLAAFGIVSVAAGALAWRVIGPRRLHALPVPIVAAFVALYLAGHRFGWQIGPMVELFGFDVALVFDLALALVAALLAAIAQRPVLAILLRRARSA